MNYYTKKLNVILFLYNIWLSGSRNTFVTRIWIILSLGVNTGYTKYEKILKVLLLSDFLHWNTSIA